MSNSIVISTLTKQQELNNLPVDWVTKVLPEIIGKPISSSLNDSLEATGETSLEITSNNDNNNNSDEEYLHKYSFTNKELQSFNVENEKKMQKIFIIK